MKRNFLVVTVLAALASGGLLHAQATMEIDPDRWGLSPTSVFDNPAPDAFSFSSAPPGATGVLRRGFEGAPPQIPHLINLFMPITLEKNRCRDCHDKPDMIDKAVRGVMAPPMSRSHYVEQDGKLNFHFRRYTCVDCHVPQANVALPVANVFSRE